MHVELQTPGLIFFILHIYHYSLNSAIQSTLLCPRHDMMENVFCEGCAEKEIQALVTRAPSLLSHKGLSDFKQMRGFLRTCHILLCIDVYFLSVSSDHYLNSSLHSFI